MSKTFFLALVVMSVVAAGCASDPDGDTSPAEIFEVHCARCHASDLSGGTGPALGPGSEAAAKTDAELTATITNGSGIMPPWEGVLTPEEIESLVEYLRSRQS